MRRGGRPGDRLRRPQGQPLERVRLPLLHVGGVDARRVGDPVGRLDERSEQREPRALTDLARPKPVSDPASDCLYATRVFGGEVHAPVGAPHRAEVVPEEAVGRRQAVERVDPIAQLGRRAVGRTGHDVGFGEDAAVLHHVRCVDREPQPLQFASDRRGAGEGIDGPPGGNAAPAERAPDELQELGLVADVSHRGAAPGGGRTTRQSCPARATATAGVGGSGIGNLGHGPVAARRRPGEY